MVASRIGEASSLMVVAGVGGAFSAVWRFYITVINEFESSISLNIRNIAWTGPRFSVELEEIPSIWFCSTTRTPLQFLRVF